MFHSAPKAIAIRRPQLLIVLLEGSVSFEGALPLPQSLVGNLNIRLDNSDYLGTIIALVHDNNVDVLDSAALPQLFEHPSDDAGHGSGAEGEEGPGADGSESCDGEDIPEEEGGGRADESKDGEGDAEGGESREDRNKGDGGEGDAEGVGKVARHRERLEEGAEGGNGDRGVLKMCESQPSDARRGGSSDSRSSSRQ